MNEEGRGFLRIRVLSAGGALPVEGAVVLISDYNGEDSEGTLLYSLRTDEGGLTQTASLPAPPSLASQSPGNGQPYSLYNVTVMKEGYYTVENIGVMVFDEVVAIQPVNLLPLSENDEIAGVQNGKVTIIENRNTNVRGDLLSESSETNEGGAE